MLIKYKLPSSRCFPSYSFLSSPEEISSFITSAGAAAEKLFCGAVGKLILFVQLEHVNLQITFFPCFVVEIRKIL